MSQPTADHPIRDRVVVVTGGGNGIGAALCRRFHREGARHVAVLDRDAAAAAAVADACGGSAHTVDVTDRESLQATLRAVIGEFGGIDLCASNAGVQAIGGADTPVAQWQAAWDVNLMSQVHAAELLVPHYLERGSGTFLQTASAGGLLIELGSAAYTVTKAGVIAFAEWLSATYRRRGIDVSVLCPAGVQTDFLTHDDPAHSFLHTHAISPDEVAEDAVRGLAERSFLIVPEAHGQVLEFYAEKSRDYDRYLHHFSRIAQKMERKRQRAESQGATTD